MQCQVGGALSGCGHGVHQELEGSWVEGEAARGHEVVETAPRTVRWEGQVGEGAGDRLAGRVQPAIQGVGLLVAVAADTEHSMMRGFVGVTIPSLHRRRS